MSRVEAIAATARSIEVGGQKVALIEATHFIEEVLVKVINTVLAVSKNAMRMVYSLDDVTVEVKGAGQCVAELQAINRQTRFLALNAAIEATRAGKRGGRLRGDRAGNKGLSNQTDATVSSVSNRIISISSSVSRGHELLRDIASADMSEHITDKERLDFAVVRHRRAERRFINYSRGNGRRLSGAVSHHCSIGNGPAIPGPHLATSRPCR